MNFCKKINFSKISAPAPVPAVKWRIGKEENNFKKERASAPGHLVQLKICCIATAKRIYTFKNRLRYSRGRALQSLADRPWPPRLILCFSGYRQASGGAGSRAPVRPWVPQSSAQFRDSSLKCELKKMNWITNNSFGKGKFREFSQNSNLIVWYSAIQSRLS